MLHLALALVAPLVQGTLPPEQETLRANLAEELAKEFVRTGGWVLDYGEARKRATVEKKLLFVYFTRTYAP